MITNRYLVDGMSCEHCVHAVTEEVSALPTVTDVAIELVPDGTSTVTVDSGEPLSDDQIRQAIDEAGYTLVGHAA
jgi:copper chaperone CopZ